MRIYSQIVLLLTVLATPAVFAGDASAVSRLIALLEPISSFSAHFEQHIVDRDGVELEHSAGQVVVARGNRFRWDTLTPWPQQLVSDGATMWQYDVDLEQVIERAFDAKLQQTPGLLLGGDVAAIDEQYEILEQDSGNDATSRFVLIPRNSGGIFVSLIVEFEGLDPVSMTLEDSFGQHTVFEFSGQDRNTPIEETVFKLHIPEGVDVLSNAR